MILAMPRALDAAFGLLTFSEGDSAILGELLTLPIDQRRLLHGSSTSMPTKRVATMYMQDDGQREEIKFPRG